MFRVSSRRRDTRSATFRRSARPAIEGLEDRLLLYATSGGQWTYGQRITFSFMPDGTNLGGGSLSNLNAAMAAEGISTKTWQDQFRKAAATWATISNINFSEVPDDGSPFGTYGNQQDDPRFGDIRIGGESMGVGYLAVATLPPPINGGTEAGDIFMNSSQQWGVNSTGFDILTVALHEIGHALGMSHSAISSAVMYAYYTTTKQQLTSDDIAGIQSIYGPRQQDIFDSVQSNQYATSATPISSYIDGNGQLTLTGLDIYSNVDADWYTITVPSTTTGTMTVTMQSSGLSLLSPKIQVYDASLRGLVQVGSANYGDTVTATVTGVTPGQIYYFRAMAGVGGPSGVGAYALQVNFGSGTMSPVQPPNTVVPWQDSTGLLGSSGLQVGSGPGNSKPGQAPAWGWQNQHGGSQISTEMVKIGGSWYAGDALEVGSAPGQDAPPTGTTNTRTVDASPTVNPLQNIVTFYIDSNAANTLGNIFQSPQGTSRSNSSNSVTSAIDSVLANWNLS